MKIFISIFIFAFSACLLKFSVSKSIYAINHEPGVILLNVSAIALRQKCKLKGGEVNENFEKFMNSYLSRTTDIHNEIPGKMKKGNRTKDYDNAFHDFYYMDPNLRQVMKKLTDVVLLCLDEEDIAEESKQIMINTALEKVSVAGKYDGDCFDDAGWTAFRLCTTTSDPKGSTFIPLPLIYSHEECINIFKTQECYINLVKNCKESTRTAMHTTVNGMREYIRCDGFSHLTQSAIITEGQ
ncbi:uncharacterized protein LOC127289110 isoform X2 [Leptopilina boulardi]|uniref:uncharacterized protein LOC127289110 isoform X2 n=1 Tax=Leptopilina boulardi TaxID=63433 RepID=UPI0021F61D36|nr:uncharacterized protein LOC127289110 isoform X2 [Leptopilina boulardi]